MTNPMSYNTQGQGSPTYRSLTCPPNIAPYLQPHSAPWLDVPSPPQQQTVYAPQSVHQTGPWLTHPEMPYNQPQHQPYEIFPSSLPAQEKVYLGPKPRIPMLIHRDPAEFARLKMTLENLLPAGATELFKYQILVDHLKLEEASLIADSYLTSVTPYSDTMTALNERFGQPHQLALKRIAQVMDAPDIKRGDHEAFQRFALQIRALVGMLETLGVEGEVELKCGSHVARLLGKLPPDPAQTFADTYIISLIQCIHYPNSPSGSSTKHGVRAIPNLPTNELMKAGQSQHASPDQPLSSMVPKLPQSRRAQNQD